MRYLTVEVPAHWASEAQRGIARFIALQQIVRELEPQLPDVEREWLKKEMRGIDNRARMLYDWRQVNNTHNENNTKKSHVSTSTEVPMGDEEE